MKTHGVVFWTLGCLAACGGDEAATVDASNVARVEATIEYGGSAHGALLLAAFTSVPPQGPPLGLAQEAAPTFPVTLVLEDLAPQTLHVLAVLDVAPASPTQPGPEDVTAWSEPLELELGETTQITLVLEDP